ncbi:MAG: hypothetical protein AAF532_04965 [Planctomycetota bacterium]
MRASVRRRGPSFLIVVLVAGAALSTAVAGTLGILHATGQIDLASLFEPDKGPRVTLVSNARPIAAYSRVTRTDVMNPETGQLHTIEMTAEQAVGSRLVAVSADREEVTTRVTAVEFDDADRPLFVGDDGITYSMDRVTKLGGAFVHHTDAIGRVVRAEKSPNFAFAESSFLPQGSRPGIAGGTPPGMRALTVEAGKIEGVHLLSTGDRVDLVAAIPAEQAAAFDRSQGNRLPGGELVADTRPGNSRTRRAEARVVARNAYVVSAVTTRARPITSSSLTQGTTSRTVPVQELVFAVAEEDVSGFSEALAMSVPISCLSLSGMNEEVADTVPEGFVDVPVGGRDIAAYFAISRDDLVDPKTRRERTVRLPADEVEDRNIVTDASRLLGRVLRRDRMKGQFFSEDDLLPPGTPSGLAAGVPPGMRMMILEGGRIVGADVLRIGERFDVIATIPRSLAADRRSRVVESGPVGLGDRAAVRPVAANAVIVAPVGSPALRMLPAASEEGGENRIVIAVAAGEVPQLSEAVNLDWTLTALARGAEADDPTPPVRPAAPGGMLAEAGPPEASAGVSTYDPFAGTQSFETIIGGERQRRYFVPPTGAGAVR